eukprot:TRINITY_DN7559_c0_g1_i1.p1 TRINITY_DN7559_c0_g1~~TRINITY_DN7559_c0_g1_i1.p1  ORF type:complete len:402 (+),score=63.61 TRINITY_DN7559_c0_g1_i1:54-1208(+)
MDPLIWGGLLVPPLLYAGNRIAVSYILNRTLTMAKKVNPVEFRNGLDVTKMTKLGGTAQNHTPVYTDIIETADGRSVMCTIKGTGWKGIHAAWSIHNEVEIIHALRGNPSVPRIVGVATHTPSLGYALVYEYIEGRSLFELVKEGSLSMREKFLVMKSVTRVLKDVHGSGVMHRDVKSMNIVVDVTAKPVLNVSLIDFGTAGFIHKRQPFLMKPFRTKLSSRSARRTTEMGTTGWIAPEVWSGVYDERCDVFSFAMVLFEIAANKDPWPSEDLHKIPFILDEKRPDTKGILHQDFLIYFMVRCWAADPSLRPSFATLYDDLLQSEHAFHNCDSNQDGNVTYNELLSCFPNALKTDFEHVLHDPTVPQLNQGQFLHLYAMKLKDM